MNRDDFLILLSANQWSNAACIGYAIKTCKALDYSDKEINTFINTILVESIKYVSSKIKQGESIDNIINEYFDKHQSSNKSKLENIFK